jgi:hypothetical protein
LEDTNDARFITYAAWDDSGLYLMSRVRDDFLYEVDDTLFSPIPLQAAADAIVLFMDPHSSHELYSDVSGLMRDLYESQGTYNFWYLRTGFDRDTHGPDSIDWNWLNPELRDTMYDEIPLNSAMTWSSWGWQDFSRSEAEQMGFYYEVVYHSAHVAYHECFIRWETIGHPFGQLDSVEQGQKIAFSIGYDDIDTGQDDVSALRWRCRADPWSGIGLDGGSPDCWGDIHLVGSLEDTLAAHGTVASWSCDPCTRPKSGIRQRMHAPHYSGTGTRVRFFTVSGRRIPDPSQAVARGDIAPRGILIRCEIDSRGTVISRSRVVAGRAQR